LRLRRGISPTRWAVVNGPAELVARRLPAYTAVTSTLSSIAALLNVPLPTCAGKGLVDGTLFLRVARRHGRFRLQGCYLLWRPFPRSSTNAMLCHSSSVRQNRHVGPTTPVTQRLPAWHVSGRVGKNHFGKIARSTLRPRARRHIPDCLTNQARSRRPLREHDPILPHDGGQSGRFPKYQAQPLQC
jgi:hypothetical protein